MHGGNEKSKILISKNRTKTNTSLSTPSRKFISLSLHLPPKNWYEPHLNTFPLESVKIDQTLANFPPLIHARVCVWRFPR